MELNVVVIIIILLILIRHYVADYQKGLRSAVFFLLLAPLNLVIEFNDTLPALTIHRFIILLMFIAWLRNGETPKRVRGVPLGGLIILIVITTGISVLLSDNFSVSIKRYLYFVFESVIFFFIIVNSIKSEKNILSLIKTMALSLVVVALLGIIERYTQFNPTALLGSKLVTKFEHFDISTSNDVTATYLHRILFGVAMAIGVIYSLFLIDKSQSRREKFLFRIAALMTVSALYFGMSRGPWLAFCIASIITVFCGRKSLKKKYYVIVALTILVFIIRPGTLETLQGSYRSTFQIGTVKEASYEWRYIVLNMAYTKVTHADSILNFLFGFGQGSHLFLHFPKVMLPTGQFADFYSWDNEYAVILLENGYIGILLYACFYFSIVKSTFLYCLRKNIHWELMVLPMTAIILLMFMKASVKFFAPQLIFLEFTNIAFASAILSNFSLMKDRVAPLSWINQSPEEITK